MDPKPIAKWVGGKTKLLPLIMSAFPEEIDTYYEPFVGAGAVLLEMIRQKRCRRIVINDTNADLISAYRAVQQDVEGLIRELTSGRYVYDRAVYLEIRAEQPSTDVVLRAARFMYLNRTCFNGLYRVNKAGQFNVPFGKFKNPLICDSDNLRAVSRALRKVIVQSVDFSGVVVKAKKGDAVYFDPPYYPISETSSFTDYTPGGFGLQDHWRLAGVYRGLVKRGVRAVLSNSLCEETGNLYASFTTRVLTASRNVGGPASYRKPVQEMLVYGGPVPDGQTA